MTVMKKDVNRAGVEEKGIVSTEADSLLKMPLGSQPVKTQESRFGELAILILIAAHHTVAHGLQMLGDVSVGETSENDEFDGVK